jgi:hypothetical protein
MVWFEIATQRKMEVHAIVQAKTADADELA